MVARATAVIEDAVDSVQKHQAVFLQAGWSFAQYYLNFARTYQDDFDALDRESANLLTLRAWLANQQSKQSARLLIDLIKALTAYLRRPERASELLIYCQSGSQACKIIGTNSGWLYLLRYEAYNFLGEWDRALSDAETAIRVAQESDPVSHARATLALGRLQFNRGDYAAALETLAEAERLLTAINDLEGVATAQAEFAAYHLNRGELDQALGLYLEVDRLRRQVDPTGPSNHTLLMLGVVHRNKGEYEKGAEYLEQLLARGETEGNASAIATASHHLAWLHLRQQNMAEARRLSAQAKQLYLEINDPRGASDADEQLGLIALLDDDIDAAEAYLKRSLTIRQRLGNQQGAANSLGLLADLYARKGNIRLGLQCMWQSWTLYHHLGVLTRQRVFKKAKQFWQLAVVKRW
jgi:tetratricopeptide (TPR) repeat protein